MAQYIFKNYIRQYINLIKRNKMKFIYGGVISVILILISIDFINLITSNNCEILYISILVYSIAKIFQEIPVINIPFQIVEFKILKPWQLKSFILLKCVYSSTIALNIIYMFPELLMEIDFYRLSVLCIINISANIICFFVNQTRKKNLLRLISVIIFIASYYFNSITIILIFTVLSIIKLIMLKYIDYDLMLPYAHAINNISNNLIEGNTEGLAKAQIQISKSKSHSKIDLIEKNYDSKYFSFFKEISRAIHYDNKYINICVTSFILMLSVSFINATSKLVYVIIFMSLLYICDNFLNILNNSESTNKRNGLYFPYTVNEILIQKYIPHLCIILIPFLSVIFILKYVSLISVLVCFFIVPIRNILNNFKTNRFEKYINTTLNVIILLTCMSNLV